MKHLRKFENYNVESDNSKFRDLEFVTPYGDTNDVDISELIGKVVIDIKYDYTIKFNKSQSKRKPR